MATKVTGSVAFTPKRRLARTRVRPNAPARPTPMPMSASVSAQIYVPHAQDSHWNFIAAMSSKCRPDAWPRSRYRIARNAIRDSRIATSANKRAASRAEARLSTAGKPLLFEQLPQILKHGVFFASTVVPNRDAHGTLESSLTALENVSAVEAILKPRARGVSLYERSDNAG